LEQERDIHYFGAAYNDAQTTYPIDHDDLDALRLPQRDGWEWVLREIGSTANILREEQQLLFAIR